MEELGEWDRVLLGCAYREPFGNLHHHPPPSPHHRSSDVDFADVFGGPPRRSSFYEGCRSLTDSLESSSAHSRRPPSSGLAAAEKPAFGELSSPAQRRHLEDDFFGDIFPCSDSWSSTPRKLDRNSFPSAPGSRVLSPSRLVFVGRLSLPSQPSVPKLKGEDHPPFSSPTRHAPYRVRSPEAFSKSSQSKRHAASLEVDLPSDDDNMSTSIGLSNDQIGNNDNKVLNDIYMEHKGDAGSTAPEGVLPELDSNYWSRISTGNSGMINNSTEEVSVAILGTKRPELKSVHQHFKDDFDKNGYEQSTRQPEKACGGQRDANSDVKVKKQAQRLNFVAHVDAVCRKMKDIPVYLEDKMHVSRVKGRVKEFIKILNLDGSPKYKDTFEGGDRKPKEKNSVQSKIEVEVSVSTAKTDEEVKFAPSDKEGACAVDFVEVNEILNKGRIPNFYMSSTVPVINDSSSERNDTLGPSSDSTQESIKASVCNIEESHYEDFDECLVEQLSQKQTENQQAGLHQDQIKIANAKIREWSKGKEGNIRSLLSTLQYVLWLESGWKPVPLVDIIEGSSVKKAYQKALLCLHPDKLQQRGAAEHQKYISEKVFDILQHHAPVDGGLVAISNFYTTVLSNEATLK